MEILGIITARGGSKGIPNKNLALIDGVPMISYTCNAAKDSHRLTRIVLSTDDENIAKTCGGYGIEVPFMRPRELASDETLIINVIRHALDYLDEKENYKPELVVLLQPTSPLRRAEDIDAAVDIIIRSGVESVVSVHEVPHQYSPVSLMQIKDGKLTPYLKEPFILRRQDKPKVYARNGPAVLVVRRETVLNKNSLYGDTCLPYLMDFKKSIDIDTSIDLEIASFLLKKTKGIA